VTPKGQGHDPNTLKTQYLENSWRCYYSNNRWLLVSLLWGSIFGYLSERQLGFFYYKRQIQSAAGLTASRQTDNSSVSQKER